MGYENERAWYVIQSYSGMENAVKKNTLYREGYTWLNL